MTSFKQAKRARKEFHVIVPQFLHRMISQEEKLPVLDLDVSTNPECNKSERRSNIDSENRIKIRMHCMVEVPQSSTLPEGLGNTRATPVYTLCFCPAQRLLLIRTGCRN